MMGYLLLNIVEELGGIMIKYFNGRDYIDINYESNLTNYCGKLNEDYIDLSITNWYYADKNLNFRYGNIKDLFIFYYKKYRDKVNSNVRKYFDYLRAINNVVEIKLNKYVLYELEEKSRIYDGYRRVLMNISKDGKYFYEFNNSFGIPICRGINFAGFDRERFVSLFKEDITDKYYILDFSGFVVYFLKFIFDDKKYFVDNFYDYYADYFNMDRGEFKKEILSYLNGSLKINEKIKKYFSDISDFICKFLDNIKVRLGNGRYIYVDKSYKVLGYIIYNLAYDYIKELVFRFMQNGIKLNYLFFDEFMVSNKYIDKVKNIIKVPYKIKEI